MKAATLSVVLNQALSSSADVAEPRRRSGPGLSWIPSRPASVACSPVARPVTYASPAIDIDAYTIPVRPRWGEQKTGPGLACCDYNEPSSKEAVTMQMHEVVEVIEASNVEEVDELLAAGWKLVAVVAGSRHSYGVAEVGPIYVLGKS